MLISMGLCFKLIDFGGQTQWLWFSNSMILYTKQQIEPPVMEAQFVSWFTQDADFS